MEAMNEDVQYIARNLLGFFRRTGVSTNDDLSLLADTTQPVNEHDVIRIEHRPSMYGTTALTVSYIRQDRGIPVELRINAYLHYGALFIQTDEQLRGFEPRLISARGCMVQTRQTAPQLEAICRELALIEAGLRSNASSF